MKIREFIFTLSLCLMPIAHASTQTYIETPLSEPESNAFETLLSEVDLGIEWDALMREGLARFEAEDFEESVLLLTQAIEIAEQAAEDREKIGYVVNLLYLALAHEWNGSPSNANSTYIRLGKVVEEVYGENHPEMADLLAGAYGPFLVRQKEYAAAEEAFRLSLSIHEKLHGKNSLQVTSDLVSLAEVHALQQDTITAKAFYKRARSIREELLGSQHSDVVAIDDALTTMALGEPQNGGGSGIRLLNLEEEKAAPEPKGGRFLNLEAEPPDSTDASPDSSMGVMVNIGGTDISLLTPSGFCDIGSLSPDIRTKFEDLTPTGSRLLAAFGIQQDCERLTQGEAPLFNRYAMIQVFGELEELAITEEGFAELRDALDSDRFLTDELRSEVQSRFDALIENPDERLELGETHSLGIISEGATHVSQLALVNYFAGDRSSLMIVSTNHLLLKDKVVFAYVYSSAGDESDMSWIRSTTDDWINELMSSNPPIAPRSSSSASSSANSTFGASHDGSLIERVGEKAVIGAMLGAFAGLILVTFAFFKRR